MSLYLGENKIADNTCSRNIGEIVASTIPLSDAGLHLLDGALISNVGSYAKFVNYIAGLVTDYPDLFTTEANWQQSVTDYGVCGKFVYDSGNNTVRLPKITGFTEGTIDVTALGDLVQAGLPNITGEFRCDYGDRGGLINSTLGSLVGSNRVSRAVLTKDSNSGYDTITLDASISSSIYGNSDTVQPQTIKVLYYIVIASSITNELNLDVADMATKSLDNLDNLGKNIANWSNNVTNCITEIPQDIKLELNNGTLTLKAGSKVYVPNGFESDGTTPKFDVVTISSDLTHSNVWADTNFFLYLSPNRDAIAQREISISYCETESGATSTATTQYRSWYDTTNNVIKWTDDYGTNWESGFSFPLAILSETSSSITSIDQVFNGFGYIGSTVFALPGVKGLIPNGRNADGSLKNAEFEISNVLMMTQSVSGWNGRWSLYFNASGVNAHPTELEYISDTKPTSVYTPSAYWYSPLDNKLYLTLDTGTTWTQANSLRCVDYTEGNTKITSLTSKTAFHALDYNDSSTISGWSAPSSRYIDLTLGASGSTYTAPANGWFMFRKVTKAAGQWCRLTNKACDIVAEGIAPVSGNWVVCYCPVAQGQIIEASYTAAGDTKIFRFIYAEGEN